MLAVELVESLPGSNYSYLININLPKTAVWWCLYRGSRLNHLSTRGTDRTSRGGGGVALDPKYSHRLACEAGIMELISDLKPHRSTPQRHRHVVARRSTSKVERSSFEAIAAPLIQA